MTIDTHGAREDEVQGIFLDFYGTVAAGDRQAVVAVCQRVMDEHGRSGDSAELAREWGMRYFAAIEKDDPGSFRLLREIERDTLVETCCEFAEGFRPESYIHQLNHYLARPPLFPEVLEVLSAIGKPVCIVSNADEREIRAAIKAHGLRFDFVVTSESARCYKPHPGIFRRALELTGWAPEQVLHVGDSLHSDVAGAQRLKLHTAWVKREERISDIGEAVPDFTWTDLRPLLDL